MLAGSVVIRENIYLNTRQERENLHAVVKYFRILFKSVRGFIWNTRAAVARILMRFRQFMYFHAFVVRHVYDFLQPPQINEYNERDQWENRLYLWSSCSRSFQLD